MESDEVLGRKSVCQKTETWIYAKSEKFKQNQRNSFAVKVDKYFFEYLKAFFEIFAFADFWHSSGRINWTMTYRQDADIPLPYGIFKKRDAAAVIDYDEIWDSKNATAIWLVSNCNYRNGRIKLAKAISSAGLPVRTNLLLL